MKAKRRARIVTQNEVHLQLINIKRELWVRDMRETVASLTGPQVQ